MKYLHDNFSYNCISCPYCRYHIYRTYAYRYAYCRRKHLTKSSIVDHLGSPFSFCVRLLACQRYIQPTYMYIAKRSHYRSRHFQLNRLILQRLLPIRTKAHHHKERERAPQLLRYQNWKFELDNFPLKTLPESQSRRVLRHTLAESIQSQ
jgi:hypothetical protein